MKPGGLIRSLIGGAILMWCHVLSAQSLHPVTIGQQVWSNENLSVSHFRNGDLIPEAKSAVEWSRAAKDHKPAWCYYDNDPVNGKTHGKLYNWYAVVDPRGLAPVGWHIPAKPEMVELIDYLDGHYRKMHEVDSLFLSELNSSPEHSLYTDQGGYRLQNGKFSHFGQYGFWWSNTCYLSSHAWLKQLKSSSAFTLTNYFHHGDGFSVRVLKDR